MPKPSVKTTGFGKLISAPTRTLWSAVNHGNGRSLLAPVE